MIIKIKFSFWKRLWIFFGRPLRIELDNADYAKINIVNGRLEINPIKKAGEI